MKKEYIIGGLALLGVVGVVSYLRKPKRNSEGFFGAGGDVSSGTDGLPFSFTRKPSLIEPCSTYTKIILRDINSPMEFKYAKVTNTGGLQLISKTQFKNAYYNLPKCK